MLVLAIDTCDANGSIGLFKDGVVTGTVSHTPTEDYSSWLLPAVDELLESSSARLADIDLYAVATGPGSFTAVRIGLTTVKAWAEVFDKPIAPVSRLEALAYHAPGHAQIVASLIDAQKSEVFGALYRRGEHSQPQRIEQERVGSIEDLVAWVMAHANRNVAWVFPETLSDATLAKLPDSSDCHVRIAAPGALAPLIAGVGTKKAARGEVISPLALDANYVRRSYVEVNWKGSASAARK
jgi:tRNA threonylcarbamoyladenosine biosynthesis protein TsaB